MIAPEPRGGKPSRMWQSGSRELKIAHTSALCA
jgi:hypothetical protein